MATGSTPVWGRPYPNESDNPDVAADMKSLALSLETTPLFPTTATSSRTSVAGESVVVSPSQTLTTASSPAKGDRIQIIAHPSVTAATPVTVAIGGSKVVNGVGLTSATSFLLGAPGAKATIQYDGTTWRMIAGEQDTGWVAVTSFASGWSSASGYPLAGRIRGDALKIRGGAAYTGVTLSGTVVFFNLPAACRPAQTCGAIVPALSSGGNPAAAGQPISLAASGQVTLYGGFNSSNGGLDLNSILVAAV